MMYDADYLTKQARLASAQTKTRRTSQNPENVFSGASKRSLIRDRSSGQNYNQVHSLSGTAGQQEPLSNPKNATAAHNFLN